MHSQAFRVEEKELGEYHEEVVKEEQSRYLLPSRIDKQLLTGQTLAYYNMKERQYKWKFDALAAEKRIVERDLAVCREKFMKHHKVAFLLRWVWCDFHLCGLPRACNWYKEN